VIFFEISCCVTHFESEPRRNYWR